MAKTYRRLNIFMAKPLGENQSFTDLLTDAPVDIYPISDAFGH